MLSLLSQFDDDEISIRRSATAKPDLLVCAFAHCDAARKSSWSSRSLSRRAKRYQTLLKIKKGKRLKGFLSVIDPSRCRDSSYVALFSCMWMFLDGFPHPENLQFLTLRMEMSSFLWKDSLIFDTPGGISNPVTVVYGLLHQSIWILTLECPFDSCLGGFKLLLFISRKDDKIWFDSYLSTGW